jgi:LEA14-like dessication related protein
MDGEIYIHHREIVTIMNKKTVLILSISTVILLILIVLGIAIYHITDFRKPETSVEGFEVVGIDEDLEGFTVELILKVYNPNPLSLEIISVRGYVMVDDTKLGDIYNRTGLEISGRASDQMEITFHIDDLDSTILSGNELIIEGRTIAKYLGKEGDSKFSESINLDIPVNGENLPPVPLILGPHNARPLMEVTFDGSTSFDRDGEIVSFSWDLGDGSRAEGSQVTHRYTTGGVYSIVLTVVDDDGGENSASHQLIVSAI